ncbi:multidrug effflux MFS transporter [Candidatus Symbiobacter mobilis]|uniref:Bcr/CflA family efflux transporter n=1 Tax=Candidatus Symbiobacter mobilis CR TaxID=946483 RepID=U5NCL8_9BURK|nr:multidrug effflux MFS transporter [Candidatus Symbiobacter mobilis]AGX87968.1 major facilitator superfamily permease [Candidatus Symbiobacter mobilis CR]
MNPDAHLLWRAPPWALAVLLAMLAMLGPFSIDTYLPAFAGIAQSLHATPVQMQQTLSAYLFGFAFMSLFHGAISDSVGRRPVVLWGLAAFTLASLGCTLAQSIGQLVFFRGMQGLTTGAGIVVSRAVVRDMFPPSQAQQVMSQITIFFGAAPAIAPIIGGMLFVHWGWHSVFGFLTVVGIALWIANYRLLPETLHVSARQPFGPRNLMQGYWKLGMDPRFVLLTLSSGIPFNALFVYVLSAPAFLGEHLGLAPTQYFWFFLCSVAGIMGGAWWSGRLAGTLAPQRQVRLGLGVFVGVAIVNLVAHALFPAHVGWALLPIFVFGVGWAVLVPAVTILLLDLHPDRRGMASSLQAFVASASTGIVAGVVAPWVMHSTVALAASALVMALIGWAAWVTLHRRWPDIGRTIHAVPAR